MGLGICRTSIEIFHNSKLQSHHLVRNVVTTLQKEAGWPRVLGAIGIGELTGENFLYFGGFNFRKGEAPLELRFLAFIQLSPLLWLEGLY